MDDTLPAIEMMAMREHLHRCPRCSRHDTAVRRGLLLVRNLPSIEPSSDFMARLNARLRDLESASVAPSGVPRDPLGIGSFAALAAGLALLGYIVREATHRFADPVALRLPPVVATAPDPTPSPMTNPAFVAAISTGVPMWPAVLMADQAPQHFATAELQQAALR